MAKPKDRSGKEIKDNNKESIEYIETGTMITWNVE